VAKNEKLHDDHANVPMLLHTPIKTNTMYIYILQNLLGS